MDNQRESPKSIKGQLYLFLLEYQSVTYRVNRSAFRYENRLELKMIKKNIALYTFVSLLGFALQAWSLQTRAVDYELPDVNGQMQSLDQYKGKWLVVNYWATWCSTCMKEMPELISLHESNKDNDVVVVGISFESIEQERLKEFVSDKSIPYTVLNTEPVRVTPLGKVPALPTTYIINPEGKVVAGDVGIITQQDIEDYIADKKASNTVAEKATTEGNAS
jgi:peroxiredoxin